MKHNLKNIKCKKVLCKYFMDPVVLEFYFKSLNP